MFDGQRFVSLCQVTVQGRGYHLCCPIVRGSHQERERESSLPPMSYCVEVLRTQLGPEPTPSDNNDDGEAHTGTERMHTNRAHIKHANRAHTCTDKAYTQSTNKQMPSAPTLPSPPAMSPSDPPPLSPLIQATSRPVVAGRTGRAPSPKTGATSARPRVPWPAVWAGQRARNGRRHGTGPSSTCYSSTPL